MVQHFSHGTTFSPNLDDFTDALRSRVIEKPTDCSSVFIVHQKLSHISKRLAFGHKAQNPSEGRSVVCRKKPLSAWHSIEALKEAVGIQVFCRRLRASLQERTYSCIRECRVCDPAQRARQGFQC